MGPLVPLKKLGTWSKFIMAMISLKYRIKKIWLFCFFNQGNLEVISDFQCREIWKLRIQKLLIQVKILEKSLWEAIFIFNQILDNQLSFLSVHGEEDPDCSQWTFDKEQSSVSRCHFEYTGVWLLSDFCVKRCIEYYKI